MTKQVQLSDEAYRLLKSNKRSKESFSDVVVRTLAPRGDPMKLFELESFDGDDSYVERMRAADRRRWANLHQGR